MPIRVLRIITRLNIGGPAIHAVLLNSGLAARGFETLLVTGKPEHAEGDMSHLAARHRVNLRGVEDLGREIRPFQDLHSLTKILRIVLQFRPHVVHTHTAKAGFLGRLAAALGRVPVTVHTYHGHVFHGYFGRARAALFLNLERGLAPLTGRLIAISELQKKELAERYRVASADKFEVIPLGFQHLHELAEGRSTIRGPARRKLGIADPTAVVGIIGRLVPVKDHRTFLEAGALLLAQRPDTCFLVVGDGPLRGALEAHARQLGIAQSVHFLGWRHDLAPVYAAMDLCCLSSRNEGTPVALIEALAAGVPVVATSVGGVPDVLHNGQWGRIVPCGLPSALAEAMLASLQDEHRTDQARTEVLARYSSERLLDDIESLYIRLLRQAGVRNAAIP